MPRRDISEAATSDMSSSVTDFSVPPEDTDGPGADKETEYINEDWEQQLAYYKTIPELQKAIDTKARWTVGNGFTAEPATELMLMEIKGNGRDTFNSIIENQQRVKDISGDSFAEIIREGEQLVNLKPLNPGRIKIIANQAGLITGYKQVSPDGTETPLALENVFHLIRNRVADEIHGTSVIDSLEPIVLSRNEAMEDYRQVMHRHVKPRIVWKVDFDDETEIADFKAKQDQAVEFGENLIIPKNTAEHEILSMPASATMNPITWIRELNQYFYQSVGVPQVILGGSQEFTIASAKIAVLAFLQEIKEDQKELQEQILSQLNLEIEFKTPVTMANEILDDRSKEEQPLANEQPLQAQPQPPQGAQT